MSMCIESPENQAGECSNFFPNNIKELLKKLVCETVVLTFRNCGKEKVKIECISGDLLVVREEYCFRFINIDCICGVSASCQTLLNEILRPYGCK